MEEFLNFIDEHFINIHGEVYHAEAITMNDLKTLEILLKIAIKSKEN